MTVSASAIGPFVLKTLEQTGSYESIFLLLAAVVAVLGIASWRVRLTPSAHLGATREPPTRARGSRTRDGS
jgi:hypothetical protein